MTIRTGPFLLLALVLAYLAGCSGVDKIGEPELQGFSTLVVKYGHPGPTPDPCDDVLPIIDGNAQDAEWGSALPLIVRMTGDRGTGGPAFNVELRAVWTDESRLGGKDRIYFMVRYADDDLNDQADLLAYISRRSAGEFCTEIPEAPGFCVSPPPLFSGVCDPQFLTEARWERINRDGKEDQVLLALSEADDPNAATDLVDVNQRLLENVGPEIVPGATIGIPGMPVDFWIWRATRSNLHPVAQFAAWEVTDPETGIPDVVYSRFLGTSGFAEDGWVDAGGVLRSDGLPGDLGPFVKNFATNDPVPDRLVECPSTDRGGDDGGEEEVRNAGLPVDLVLWWKNALRFGPCDTSACTRVGRAVKWSTRLQDGEFDFVHGWALQVPTGSRRDVRSRGTYAVTQDKGFGVRTVEFMRDMNTGNSDDLVITPLVGGAPVASGRYRLTVGIFDNSGRVASGSSEIYLEFAPPEPRLGVVDRCR